MQKKLCKYCGDYFITPHSYKIACSKKECKEKYHHEKSYLKSKCEICGTEFEYRRSKPKRFCSKKCAQASPEVKEKMVKSQKETFMEKYGVEHPMQTGEVKKHFKDAMIEKYGVEHALQSKEILEKQIATVKEKYGTTNVFQNEEIKEISGITKIKKYGDENYRNDDKRKHTMLERYGVDHYSKSKDFKNKIYKNTYDKLLNSEKFGNTIILTPFPDYKGVDTLRYEFICKQCDFKFFSSIDNGNIPKCPKCSKSSISSGHNEVYEYTKFILPEEEIALNSRDILPSGKELDIYIPSRKIAIEYDGLFWHSEISGNKSKNYHLDKTNECESLGIKLIHIFENEWYSKKEIVQSILSSSVGLIKNKIYARQCKIQEVKISDKNIFLLQNHLQGTDSSSVRVGLYYDKKLVSLMTFGKSRFDSKYEWEIIRFCNMKNYIIVGAASRLFKYFIKEYNPKSVITYSDRRYFNGNTYESLGFEFISKTRPNYWYISPRRTLINRMSFQKKALKNKIQYFQETLSEWENMKNNGYDRIWDSGNLKFGYQND